MPESDKEPPSSQSKKYWFFLGGHDLEMITIRELLDAHFGSQYSDAGLRWGAKASEYEAEIKQKIEQGYVPVLIELENDIEPLNAVIEIIDHHGDAAGNDQPTSLEQAYTKLGMDFASAPMEHKAIAANDRGYVYELREQGFSQKEIYDVRRKEWAVQGISQEEIEQARNAIATHLVTAPGLVIVDAPNDRSGLISDLLLREFTDDLPEDHPRKGLPEPEVLLAIGPNEVSVFAPGSIVDDLSNLAISGQWWGGALPERGYWGINRNQITDETLQAITDHVREAACSYMLHQHLLLESGSPEGGEPASFTQFILPISYLPEILSKPSPAPYYKQLTFCPTPRNPAPAHALIDERRRYFTEETGNMLYQHAAWFKLTDYPSNDSGFSCEFSSTQRNVRLKFSEPRLVLFNWAAAVGTHHNNQTRTSITNPLLNGFVILEVYGATKLTMSEQMEINETLRHIQMPFKNYYKKEQKHRYRDLTHKGFPWARDSAPQEGPDLLNWKKWIDLLRFPVKDDKTGNFYSVAPGSWINEGISVARQESWADENHVFKASDTKAFVWACAVQDQSATETRRRMIDAFLDSKTRLAVACKHASEYWAFGDWIKYLNIDKPGVSANKCEYHRDMLQCSSYEQNWVSEPYRTYTRWADYGTLYGYSDHSGCAFISDYKDPPFWLQWRTIYRDQALFLLYVRATLFRFSRAISSITQKRVTDGDAPWAEKRFKEEFRTLRQQFVYFANLYQFPLLSTEQQGLEMYKAQREALDIDSLYKEVQSQIDNAHSYAALKSQEDTVDLTATITVLGIPLLLAGLVAALLGMDLSVHYEAIRDFIGSYGEEDFFASFSTAEGPYKLALWLAAIIAVLLPIRLFENKLVDLRTGGQPKKTATFFNLISFGLWMVSLLISIFLTVNVNGLLGLAGGVVAVALILMTQPIRRFQTAKGAYRARRKGVEASSKQSRSRFYALTMAVGAGLKAFFGRPAATTSTLDEFKLIIEREVKRQKIDNG